MGTIQRILEQLCGEIANTGAQIRMAYDKTPLTKPPCRYMTGAVTGVQLPNGGILKTLHFQCFSLS